MKLSLQAERGSHLAHMYTQGELPTVAGIAVWTRQVCVRAIISLRKRL